MQTPSKRKRALLAPLALLPALTLLNPTSATAVDSSLFQAEAMSLSSSAGKVVGDSAAEGGSALKVWSNATATKSFSLLSASNELVIRARGEECSGGPVMTVRADGQLLATITVGSTSYASYRVPAALGAGGHTLAIAFTNDRLTRKCDRNLVLDAVAHGSGSSTSPVPEPSPTASAAATAPSPSAAPTSSTTLPPGATSGGTVLFDADVARSGLSKYGNVISPQTISVLDDPILGSSRKVLKMTVRDSDTGGITSNPRAQVETPRQFTQGQDLWVGWSMMFPTGFPKALATSSDWMTFAEFYGPPYSGPAPVTIGMHGAPREGLSYASHEGGTNYRFAWQEAPLVNNKWYDVVMHEYLSEDITKGYVEIYLNTGTGWRRTLIHGQPRYYTKTIDISNNGGANYHKLALYRKLGMYDVMSIYFADHKVGTSFTAVAPRSYG